ncbi:MAG: hypothetical protein PW788_03305 [Micavibrio sp.]|nr:hypothetical protein [Micavibrio sp.]
MKTHYRTVHLTALVSLMLAAAPLQSAMAWSSAAESDVSTAAGTSRFSDPDDALEGFATTGGSAGTGLHITQSVTPAAPFACTGGAGGCACPNCQGNK